MKTWFCKQANMGLMIRVTSLFTKTWSLQILEFWKHWNFHKNAFIYPKLFLHKQQNGNFYCVRGGTSESSRKLSPALLKYLAVQKSFRWLSNLFVIESTGAVLSSTSDTDRIRMSSWFFFHIYIWVGTFIPLLGVIFTVINVMQGTYAVREFAKSIDDRVPKRD